MILRFAPLSFAVALLAQVGSLAAQTAPAAPSWLVGWEVSGSRATLQWDDPSDTTITKYQWRYRGTGQFNSWTDLSGSDDETTTFTTGRLSGGRRWFQVRACAGTTCGGGSQTSIDMGFHQVTDVSITSTPTGDTYTVGDTISVAVTWATQLSGSGIELTISIGGNGRKVIGSSHQNSGGRGTVTFHYPVVAQDVDADGISIGPVPLLGGTLLIGVGGNPFVASNVGRHTIRNSAGHKVDGGLTAPAAPTDLAAAASDGEVTLSWTDPQLSSLGAYEVRYAPATQNYPASWTTVPGDGTTTEYTATSLTNETEYKFQLRAVNGVGGGAAAEVRATPTTFPTVTDVRIASTPVSGDGDTYGGGEVVLVDVEFTDTVTVTGTPRLALTVGSAERQAQMLSASDNTIRFRYVVVAADVDADGIGIAADALDTNGATIASTEGYAARLGLGSHAFTANASHKVYGRVATAPAVSAVSITSTPVSGGNTYGGGERIEVAVTYHESVPITVSGSPRLAFRLDSGPVRATLRRTEGQTLHFGYVVQTGDLDADGITIPAQGLELNGGTIRSLAGANASLNLGRHAILIDGNHRVVGSNATQPTVTSVSITSTPASGDTYGAGEAIRAEVTFSLDVAVTGSPQLSLTISSRLVTASYQGASDNTLTFRYLVQSADRDTDGVSVSALALNSGTIRSLVNANASLSLGSHAITNDSDHKVDGRTATVPRVNAMAISSAPASGDSYGGGETIAVQVGFTTPVTVTGTPRLALAVGSRTRYAAYSSGSGASALTFQYAAAALDVDPDGISVGASALELDGGTIRSEAAANAALGLNGYAISNADGHKVDGRSTMPVVNAVSVTSSPTRGDTYEAGETISVQVGYALTVSVEGTPQLALGIGSDTVQASFATGSGTTALTFSYAVKAEDLDANGIDVGADALTLNGGRIRSASGANAALSLGSHAITAAASHKVNGGITVPAVTQVAITSDAGSDSTYAGGDVISVQVSFQLPVTVTGVPQLALEIGSDTAQADYASGSGTTTLTFEYEVGAQLDADGISIAASALALNSGTIRSGGGTNASLTLGTHALGNQASHKVDGRTTVPQLVGVTISSDPGRDSTYAADDRIEVQVTFQMAVTVTGTPRLALEIGSDTVQANFASGSGTKTLTFRYTVLSTNADTDGISIGAGALTLNAGTIRSSTATNANLALGSHALGNQAAHRVDGARVAAAPSGLTATPAGAGQAELRWDNPDNSAITGYEFRRRSTGFRASAWSQWSDVPSSTASTTAHTVRSLPFGDNEFEVRAVVGMSMGPASRAKAYMAAFHVKGVGIPSRPANGSTYRTGDTIVVSVKFTAFQPEVEADFLGGSADLTLEYRRPRTYGQPSQYRQYKRYKLGLAGIQLRGDGKR